jgi:UDPglucose--hexose-1-phosphate uridylyltransferase
MSELRQDPTTHDWVIIAKDRAKRPDQFKSRPKPQKELEAYSAECPFCPGNENFTPSDVDTVMGEEGGWKLRAISNKFAALTPEGDSTRSEYKLLRWSHGYGHHEVVIETRLHNRFIPFLENLHVEQLIKLYRRRYQALKGDTNVRIIIIFKNHGKEAGTSLEHPHSQIVASPIVPPFIRRKYEVAMQYFDNTGRCLHLDLQRIELEQQKRIVSESTHFVTLHPFASHYPFETWIMPRVHKSSFGDISDDEVADLARVLKNVLLRLYIGLADPGLQLRDPHFTVC